MLQIYSLFARASGLALNGNLLIMLGIGLSACVLGIEVACIVMLIRKLSHAKRERDDEGGAGNFAMLAFSSVSIPFAAEHILALMVALNALAALIFMILALTVRSKGFDYASAASSEEEELEEEPAPAVSLREDRAADREEAVRVFDLPKEEAEKETTVAEELPTEALSDEVPVTVPAIATASGSVATPATTTTTVTTVQTSGGGNGPVRIVKIEKEFSETIRETIPGTAPAESSATAAATNEQTERLIEKIDRLINKIDGNREEQKAHIENSIILGTDEPIPADEDDDEEEIEVDAFGNPVSTDGDDEDDFDGEISDTEHFTGNERIIGFDEETGYYIVAHYRKSFTAKLIQSRPHIKHYYSDLKNALLAYNGTKSRTSWAVDSFHNGRTPIAKINVKTNQLELYLALEPETLEGTVYRGQDVGHLKKYAETPFRYKLRTPRKLKWALELIQRVCEEKGLSPIDIEAVDYEAEYPFEDTDSLVARGLIKEYIREEKPASTFELDDTHVPSVPEMDETVIPSNANISWEFDNEVLAQKEEQEEPASEPIEEPAPEPTPEPAPEPAPAAAPTPTVIRETTRTTQMRYTEQYYGGNGEEITYKEYLTGDDPFKAEFFEIPNEKKESEPVEAEAAEENVAAEETAAADEFVDDTADEFIDDAIDEFSAEDVDGIVDEEETEVEMVEETADEAVEDALDGVAEETEEFVEDGLDWGVPAGLTQQETVVIDSYSDVPAEEVYDYADAYEEESAADAYDEAYDENPEEYAETFAEEAYDEDAYAETDGTEEYADEPVDETYSETDSEDGAYDEPVMKPRMNPDVALVSLSMLEENFEDGAQIDLAALKAKGLVLPTAKTLKIYNSGTVTKSFEIDAEQVTMEAIFAISHAGGHINFIKPKGGDNNVGFKGFQK